jgi:formyl-CoA transferase
MRGALRGTKVVELGTYVAAPALGSMLGMLGANVVKIEPPEGDPTRKTTPWSWANYNWNKKTVALDLKTDNGRKALRRLLRMADVFIESLSPRAVLELGLGFKSVKNLNPRIIYCSIKGFASDSSSSERVGFDTVAQAEGGLMYVAGEPGKPSRVGAPCVDLSAATFGAVGILSSLFRRPRRAAFIEVPLLDVVVYWNGYWMPYIDVHGREPTHLSLSHPGFSPYGVFGTKDGFVFIGVLTDAQWKKLVSRLALPDQPRFSATDARISARDEVNDVVQKAVGALTTPELLASLAEEVPCAKVSSLMDIYQDEELKKRGVLRQVTTDGRKVCIVLPPYLRTLVPEAGLAVPSRSDANDVPVRARTRRSHSRRSLSVRANR